MKKETVLILARHPLFRKLSQEEKARLFKRFVEETVGPNVRIFQEQTPGNSLYILVEGSVLITREVGGGPVPLYTVRPPEAIGELALLSPGLRLVSAKTIDRTTYARLTHEQFQEFCEENLRAGMLISQMIFKHLLHKIRALEPLFQNLFQTAIKDLRL